MQSAALPSNEIARLHALSEYRILDTPEEGEFDECARLIAQICGTEIGAVTLIDSDRQWVKAVHGPLQRTTPRRDAFCAHTILQHGVLEVRDSLLDPRFADNPLVTAEPFLRFYAGVALEARTGLALGTICVIDKRPRQLTKAQNQALEIAASYIAGQLEMRLGVLQLLEQRRLAKSQSEAIEHARQRQKDLSALVVHDLRNPLASVSANSRYLADDDGALSPDQQAALQDIISASEKLAGMLNELLQVSRAEDGLLMVRHKTPLDLAEIARSAIAGIRAVAAERRIRLELVADSRGLVEGDKEILIRIVSNLLDNACKYGPVDSTIRVGVSADQGSAVLRVVDEGAGIPPDQRGHVFDKYFQVDQKTPVRPSFGLGLSFCRLAVEAHGGTIEVEDAAQGCVFRVTLPLLGAAPAEEPRASAQRTAVGPSVVPSVASAAARAPADERNATDESLGLERRRADSQLLQREALVRASADSLVVLARQVADGALDVARAKEDLRLDQADASAEVRNDVQRERLEANIVLGGERTEADLELHGERERLKRALAMLTTQDRKDTNSDLLLERLSQLKQAKAVEEALRGLQARLDAQSQQIEDAARARDAFVAMASHELRTPLTALRLQVQSLLRDAQASAELMAPAALERLAITEDHVRRLDSLVRGLLEVSLVSSGAPPVELRPFDLSALVRELAEQLEAAVNRGGCRLVLDLEPQLLGEWDRTRVQRILTHLVRNAVKFGAAKPITLRLHEAGQFVRLEVEDQGIGIDRRDQRRIFGRFERAVSDRDYGGLGIGLWCVKQMVEELRGKITVSSELGAGSTFTVQLPKVGAKVGAPSLTDR